MPRIYHAHEQIIPQHYVDPSTGRIELRQVAQLSPAGDDRIIWPQPDGSQRTFEIQPDGSFDVPVEVAEHYLRMPGWNVGSSPFAEAGITA